MSSPVLNGQYCEVCAEYYSRRTPATTYVLNQWICDRCSEGLAPISNQHFVVRQGRGPELRVKPPKSENVAAKPLPSKNREDEWAEFFNELVNMPLGGAKAIIPRGNFKTEDRYLRKAAERYGIRLRIWNIDHKLYVAPGTGERKRK